MPHQFEVVRHLAHAVVYHGHIRRSAVITRSVVAAMVGRIGCAGTRRRRTRAGGSLPALRALSRGCRRLSAVPILRVACALRALPARGLCATSPLSGRALTACTLSTGTRALRAPCRIRIGGKPRRR